jgi:hypothetical protein
MNKIIFLVIVIIFFACAKNSDYVINKGLSPDDIIKFTSITPDSAYADSNSQVIIRVSVNPNTDTPQDVTLTTDKGIINGKSASETMTTNLNRYVDFVLTAGQLSGPVFLRTTVASSYTRDTTLIFGKAYPDTIIIRPDAFTVSAGSTLNVNIDLLRFKGYASKDQNIFLSALDSTGNEIGQFTYSESFVPGAPLSAVFSSPSTYTGKAVLKTIVVRDDGSKIAAQIKITIQ